MKSRNIGLIIALLVIIVIIYIIQNRQVFFSGSQQGTQLGPTEQVDKVGVGLAAPDFILTDYEDNLHSFSENLGKPVVLNFWASWCPFCINEMPDFEQVFKQSNTDGQNIAMIGINRGESNDQAQSFSDPLNLTYQLLSNRADDVAKAYKIQAMPSTYFIDSQGVIVDIVKGPLDAEQLQNKIYDNFHLGEEVEEVENTIESSLSPEVPEEVMQSTRAITITDGIKHNIPLADIKGGGLAKDGIPSIDDPKFITISEADKVIDDDGLGISVSFSGVNRFYPFQILVWHEIVNDTVGGQPVLVSYCPLCGTGIVFEPIVNGEVSEFGTSGKLWNSNLVMYDRQTESYWSQVLGEAVVGEMTGTILKLMPHNNLLYKDWKAKYPNGQVLSTDTGFRRNYTQTPYTGYDEDKDIFFPVDNSDDRYHPKAPTYQIEVNGVVKIYPIEELDKGPSKFTDQVGKTQLQIEFNKENKTISILRPDTQEELVPLYGFWFSVIAVHPEAEVYLGIK